MANQCDKHGVFCEQLKNVVENQKENKADLEHWQDKMEAIIIAWHKTINTELSEVKSDVKDIKCSMERLPILWEKEETTRTMVYGSYTGLVLLLGYIFYHINK